MPKIFRLVGLKGIEKPFGVVRPDMAAVPALGLFDFRQDQQRLDGFQDAGVQEAQRRQAAADQNIVVAHAGGMFRSDLAGVGRTARRADFDLHAGKTLGESFFETFSQRPRSPAHPRRLCLPSWPRRWFSPIRSAMQAWFQQRPMGTLSSVSAILTAHRGRCATCYLKTSSAILADFAQ